MNRARAATWFRRRFREEGTKARAEGEKAYMKSALKFHGVTTPQMRRAVLDFLRERELDRDEVIALVEEMYATDWFDLRSAGLLVAEGRKELLAARDARWLISLVRRSANWAQVDFLSVKILGALVRARPRLVARIPTWALDEDFWVRRAALLAQLDDLRRGGGDFGLFARIAEPMLEEREFFIRKALGWVLREVSKKRPQLVHAFLTKHRARVSGLTLREGRKHLPAELRRTLE